MKTQKYRFTPKERLKIYKDLRKRLVAYGNNEGFTGFMCLILSKYMGIKLYRYNGSLPFLPELNEHRPHKGINDVYAWFPEKMFEKRIAIVDKAIAKVSKLL